MKKLITSFVALTIFIGLASQSWAASYRLGTTTNTQSSSSGFSGGSWTDWENCDDTYGSDAGPNRLSTYRMTNEGNYEKIRMTCRGITSSGSYSSTYKYSDYFFNTSDTGSFDKTEVNSGYLPVGINFMISCDGVNEFRLTQMTAAKIAAGGDNETASKVSTTAGDGDICLWIPADTEVACNNGSVITGMRFKIDDANWPYTGKMVHDFQIRCTELETY